MAEIIKAKADADGKIIVKLFGTEYDVTKKLKDGIATLSVYGNNYEIHAEQPKKPAKKIAVKKTKDNGAEVDVAFIETPTKG